MLEKIFDAVKSNLKNPKLYVFILILLIIVLLLFPYIDANFFYYNRVDSRVEILNKISQLDGDKINSNEILKSEYDSILQEIEKQKNGSLGSVFNNEKDITISWIKFLSGGSIAWILAIYCLFIKFKSMRDRIIGIIFSLLLGALLGGISVAIPTLINPMVNYIGFPVLIITIIGILATYGSKKNRAGGSHQ